VALSTAFARDFGWAWGKKIVIADDYLPLPVLAKLLKLDFRSVPRFLRHKGVPTLAIPVTGQGHTVFVRRETAMSLGTP
jgi:hypothetical protein